MKRGICMGAAFVAAVGIFALWWLNRLPPEPADDVKLPEVAQIAKIRAKVHEQFQTGSRGEPGQIPEFDVPMEFVPVILAAMRPAERTNASPSLAYFSVIGNLTITTKSDQLFEVEIRDRGIYPLSMTINGIHCTRGGPFQGFGPPDIGNVHIDEGSQFCSFLGQIYRVHFEHADKEWLEYHAKNLRISRGLQPPPFP